MDWLTMAIFWLANFAIVVTLSEDKQLQGLRFSTWVVMFFLSLFLIPIAIGVVFTQIVRRK